MTTFVNADIKAKALLSSVRMYEIAQYCNMSESTFNRRMCKELSESDREQYLKAIEEIAAKRKEKGLGITGVSDPRQVTLNRLPDKKGDE